MTSSLSRVYALLACATIAVSAGGDSGLWCYQCNADLSQGRKSECNDPYSPAPAADLVACPRNDSYVCLKSLIFYRNVHATVRGCVPSSEKTTYCSFKEAYPDASLQCLFCDDYACNEAPTPFTNRHIIIAASIATLLSSKFLGLVASIN